MAIRRAFREYLFITLIALIGLVATFGLTLEQYKAATIQTKAAFNNDAKERLDLIGSSISSNLTIMKSVSSFYKATDDVSKQDFSTYVSEIIKNHPYIEAIAWAPLINDEDRAEFEEKATKLYPDFQLKRMDENKKFINDVKRYSYIPIYYVEPMKNNSVIGFDYASDTLRNRAAQTAIQTGQIAATGSVTLISSHEKGILLFSPVSKNQKLLGFTVGIMPMRSLIDLPLSPLLPRGNNVIVYDITENKSLLHTRSSRIAKMTEEQIVDLYNDNNNLRATRVFDVGGRKWEVTILPAKGYYSININRQTWMTLILGILFTAIFVSYMILRVRENKRISIEVSERTRELSHTQKELELILNSTMDGIIGIDKNAQIVFCNLMAPLLLGYKKSEIIGQNFHELIEHAYPNTPKNPLIPEKEPLKTGVMRALQQGMENKAVTTESFWRRNNLPMKVEYSISSLVEDNIITGAVVVFRDITERKAHEENLEHMALYDQLTQVANRRQFVELLKKSISRAGRMKKTVGVIYIDLNDFKEINDAKGHATGDLVLKAFADRIRPTIREHDTFARLGGDEFAVIADSVHDRTECAIIVERISGLLKAPLVTTDGEFSISASYGIATYPQDATDYDRLITAADTAMYLAKKDKSKSYAFYEKPAALKP